MCNDEVRSRQESYLNESDCKEVVDSQTSFTSMKWYWPVFCRNMPFRAVVLNWKRMSPDVRASNVGSGMEASRFRNVTMLSKRPGEGREWEESSGGRCTNTRIGPTWDGF